MVDGVASAVKLAEALVSLGLKTSKLGAYAPPPVKIYTGILAPFAPSVILRCERSEPRRAAVQAGDAKT